MCFVCAQGFDEYMNLVLDDAEEVSNKKGTRKSVGESPIAPPLFSRFDCSECPGRLRLCGATGREGWLHLSTGVTVRQYHPVHCTHCS